MCDRTVNVLLMTNFKPDFFWLYNKRVGKLFAQLSTICAK